MHELSTTAGPDLTFETFYAAELQSVARAVALAFGDLDLAKQATDEAFVRALEAWPRVSRMASPAGWTYRVALNCARRMARRDSHRQRAERRAADADPSPFAAAPELTGFYERIADLPQRQRVAVILRFVADMTEPEIAAAMGVRRGTVSATLRAALRALEPRLRAEPDAMATSIALEPTEAVRVQLRHPELRHV
jgi:RNA polymerase sigma-70 factor (ECF subfamily)